MQAATVSFDRSRSDGPRTRGAWHWMQEAASVYRRHALLSAGYGLLFVAIGYGIMLALAGAGLVTAMPVALGAFALAGPIMAAGLYAVVRADEAGREPSLGEVLRPRAASPIQIAYLGVIVLVAMLFWTLMAIGLFVIFLSGDVQGWGEFTRTALSTPRGIAMIVLGTLVGGVIAAAIFATTAFSIPMLMDRETDFATAIAESMRTVLSNPREMFLWAWIIVLCIAFGAVTMLIGFVFVFPLLGFATWKAYRSFFPDGS